MNLYLNPSSFKGIAKQTNQAYWAPFGDEYQRNAEKDMERGHQGCRLYQKDT